MNSLRILIMIVLVFPVSQAFAADYKFVPSEPSPMTEICILAATNEKKAMRQKIIDQKGTFKQVVNAIRCNGKQLTHFALSYGAKDTFEYILTL